MQMVNYHDVSHEGESQECIHVPQILFYYVTIVN